jgi:alpha-glucosidase
MRTLAVAVFSGLLFFSGIASAQVHQATSPGNVLTVTVTMEDGTPYYTVERFGREIVRRSRLGVEMRDGSLAESLTLQRTSESTFDETWEQPWGEERFIRNHYNELALDYETQARPVRQMTIRFRVFDDGVGFRYEWPQQDAMTSFELMDEATEITLAGDPSSWWIPAYWWNRYEYLYRNSRQRHRHRAYAGHLRD